MAPSHAWIKMFLFDPENSNSELCTIYPPGTARILRLLPPAACFPVQGHSQRQNFITDYAVSISLCLISHAYSVLGDQIKGFERVLAADAVHAFAIHTGLWADLLFVLNT